MVCGPMLDGRGWGGEGRCAAAARSQRQPPAQWRRRRQVQRRRPADGLPLPPRHTHGRASALLTWRWRMPCLVVCRATVTRTPAPAFADGIENIDIGGPAMIRAAAKNHAHVAVVVDPADYPKLLEMMKPGGLPACLPRGGWRGRQPAGSWVGTRLAAGSSSVGGPGRLACPSQAPYSWA
jgi:hypothetical protein